MVSRINDLIEQKQNELFGLLGKLIQINSESFGAYGNEAECAQFISEWCKELGLESFVYSPLDIPNFEEHPDYFPGRNLENRYNVTVRWHGKQDTDALMLMGHSDTVPIGDRSNWSVDPLSGAIKDGKIWGRGASDDKYALATAMFVIKLLKESGFIPKANLLFTAYSDEEKGGSHGALASCLKYPCDRVVNMDAGSYELWQCASGGQEVKYHFYTDGIVDSADVVAKAIPVVLDVMAGFAHNRYTELSQNPFYDGTDFPETSMRYMGIKAGDQGNDLGVGEIYFVFYTDKTKDEIYDEFHTLEEVLSEKLRPLGIKGGKFIPHTRFFHYGYTDPNCAAIRDFCAASVEAIGKAPKVCGSCLSDLSIILKYGGPDAFGVGIGRPFSSYGGAHQPDEHIDADELVDFAKVIATYIVRTLG